MDTNDLIRRIRYAASLDDEHCVRLIAAGGSEASVAEARAWRLREGESGHQACVPAVVHALLDGLIEERRGPPERPAATAGGSESPQNTSQSVWPTAAQRASARAAPKPAAVARAPERARLPVCDNNLVLKQLRIAFTLRAADVQALVLSGGGTLTDSETSALFRKPGARNYRRCGDQVLRQFLTGLARLRQGENDVGDGSNPG